MQCSFAVLTVDGGEGVVRAKWQLLVIKITPCCTASFSDYNEANATKHASLWRPQWRPKVEEISYPGLLFLAFRKLK